MSNIRLLSLSRLARQAGFLKMLLRARKLRMLKLCAKIGRMSQKRKESNEDGQYEIAFEVVQDGQELETCDSWKVQLA